jgi:hypothetical protein
VARDGRDGVLVMRDVGEFLFPDRDEPIEMEAHATLLDHLAVLHAACWGWRDAIGLLGLAHRYLAFLPSLAEFESQRDDDSPLPGIIGGGWQRFWSRSGESVDIVRALLDDPTPLVRGLASTPTTLLHGDTKIANLGCGPDGGTIMLDWALAGSGPPCADLAHYLSLNRARLPEPKADVIERYRGALERHGVDTSPWWDAQLALSLLGSMLQMAWEKALGDDDEFAWWDTTAAGAARHLS